MCAYIYVYILIHTPTAERDFKSLKFLLFYAAVWIEQEIMLSPPLPWIIAFKIPGNLQSSLYITAARAALDLSSREGKCSYNVQSIFQG